MKKRALVIVAHPDDETIWMGGMILKNSEWEWTILSLCRVDDSDRAPKFKKVCKIYNAKPLMSDLEDEKLSPVGMGEITSRIKNNMSSLEYNYIFTHGKNGEYGHIRHKEINKAVMKMLSAGELKCGEAYYFDYVPGQVSSPHDEELKIPVPNKNSDLVLNLTKEQYEKKISLVTDFYGFRHPIFETLSCSNKEAFIVASKGIKFSHDK